MMIPRSGTSGRVRRPSVWAGALVCETAHDARTVLPRHSHEAASLNLVLDGVYHERVAGLPDEHARGSLLYKPPGEPHSNRFGGHFARCLLVEIPACRIQDLAARGERVTRTAIASGPSVDPLLRGILNEWDCDDDLTPLGMDALLVELLRDLGRRAQGSASRPPEWLHDVRDLALAHCVEGIALGELSRLVGVHPSHLARVVRAHLGYPLGELLRRCRVRRAAGRLLGDEPLASIAAETGFADQSHMTRCFRSRLGLTPAVLRQRWRTGAVPDLAQVWF